MRKILIGAVLALASCDDLAHPGRQDRCRGHRGQHRRAPRRRETLAGARRGGDGGARRARPISSRRVLATGSLVAREEILVGPEVEGLRITEVLADEGQRVKKGDVLARLVADTLDAQLAQNDARLPAPPPPSPRPGAPSCRPRRAWSRSRNALERAKPLRDAGHMTEACTTSASRRARTAQAQLAAARDGLRLAEAEKAQVEAQRRELTWRRGRIEVTAPADGIVSRRMARVGGYAAGAAEPMFRIVAKGEVGARRRGHRDAAGRRQGRPDAPASRSRASATIAGTVRLVSPEVDKATRLGRVRIFLGDNPGLRVGSFARGSIETASGSGLAVPASAVLYGPDGRIGAGGARQPRRDAPDQDRASRAARWSRCAKGWPRAISWSPAPAPSCVTATPCGRADRRPGQAERG